MPSVSQGNVLWTWKQTGIKIIVAMVLVIFSVPVTPTNDYTTEPQKEVVSIYNNDFATPKSRYPYFIEVYRCINISDDLEAKLHCRNDKYPVPNMKTEIEIVVPDLTNNERDPSHINKFYKYIVFNHTSCTRGRLRERKLYNTPSNNLVSERYFLMNYHKNPNNLRREPDHCKKARRRYKLHDDHYNVLPSFKYLAYKQCLPGCVVEESQQRTIRTKLCDSSLRKIYVEDDLKCGAYI
ncbi:uncharacterized protein LOC114540391 [Dendronephthya gigantea]|uniref:uncharacterized protein LOC114540391 n=1 Tax=Dendronephthya gigantea TaxID=151771 RepID=UPI00106C8482|nr:uncharacterized protein LOC114540391 [Dendronephthya gigantea]